MALASIKESKLNISKLNIRTEIRKYRNRITGYKPITQTDISSLRDEIITLRDQVDNIAAETSDLSYRLDDKEQEVSHEIHEIQDQLQVLKDEIEGNGNVSELSERIDNVISAMNDINQATAYL